MIVQPVKMTAETAASTTAASTNAHYLAIVNSWTPEERAEKEKKFLKKIDFRLLPILVWTYARESVVVPN